MYDHTERNSVPIKSAHQYDLKSAQDAAYAHKERIRTYTKPSVK